MSVERALANSHNIPSSVSSSIGPGGASQQGSRMSLVIEESIRWVYTIIVWKISEMVDLKPLVCLLISISNIMLILDIFHLNIFCPFVIMDRCQTFTTFIICGNYLISFSDYSIGFYSYFGCFSHFKNR